MTNPRFPRDGLPGGTVTMAPLDKTIPTEIIGQKHITLLDMYKLNHMYSCPFTTNRRASYSDCTNNCYHPLRTTKV